MACVQANGIYTLINVKGGTCMDLSGGDNVSIIGYDYHGGPNQAWIFEPAGGNQTYYLKSVAMSKYLAPANEPRDGQRLIAGSPYPWRVEDVPGVDRGVRLLGADTPFCVDLSNHGDPTPGTPIELWGRWDGENQIWRLRKVE